MSTSLQKARNLQYQLVSLSSEEIKNVSRRPVDHNTLYNEDHGLCSICHLYQTYCLGHNHYIQLGEYVPKPFLIPILEQFLLYLDPNFNLSSEKQETFDILHYDKVNRRIFVAVMVKKDILFRLLYFIKFKDMKNYPIQDKYTQNQIIQSSIQKNSQDTSEQLYCLYNNLIHKFLTIWSETQTKQQSQLNFPISLLKTIFINAIPIPSIVDRVYQLQPSNTYKNVYKQITLYEQYAQHEKPQFKPVIAFNTKFKNVYLEKEIFQDIDYSSKKKNKELLESLQKSEYLSDDIQQAQYIYNKKKTERSKLSPEIHNYLVFITAVFVAMSKETSKNAIVEPKNKMLSLLSLQQNTQDAYSIFSACVNKEGYFRQAVNSCRINKSSRTVCTGNPLINSWQCVCPIFIAKNIYVPVNVNVQNIIAIKKLILNYPNYPCVCQIKNPSAPFIKNVSENNFKRFAQDLKVGDIVYRQILNNDVCLTNRFPSIREESFGAHIVKVDPTIKSLQFNLQVVKKMNADFDGDELQLYFFSQQSDVTETAILSSIPRQLITYETGKSLVGGCKELGFMIYNIKNNKDTQSIINKSIQKYFGNLTFKCEDISIVNGEIKSISKKLVSDKSNFVSSLSAYYPSSKVLAFMDDIIINGYKINKQFGQTLYQTIFNKFDMKQFTKIQLENLQNILSNTNLSEIQIEEAFTNELNNGILDLLEQLKLVVKTKEDKYHNCLVDDYIDQLRSAKLQLGQVYNDNNSRIISKYRSLPLFKKFEVSPEGQGFIQSNYIDGLNGLGLFYDTIPGRLQLYKKGNTISKDGYNTRCVSKGMENVYMGYNNIIYGDDRNIMSLDYLYDPRRYFIVTLSKQQIVDSLRNLPIDKTFKNKILTYLYNMKLKTNSINIYNTKHITKDNVNYDFILPFDVQEQNMKLDEIIQIITSRLTNKMGDILIENIIYQTYTFYLYCLLKIGQNYNNIQNNIQNNLSNISITNRYLSCLCPPGETVGLKAAMGLTEPNSQETLNAIHGGKTEFEAITLEKSTGNDRFSELVASKKGPQIVYFKLFKFYDKKEFIRHYQRISFKQLQTKYNLYVKNDRMTLDVIIPIRSLAYYNVEFSQVIKTIQNNKKLQIEEINIKEFSVYITFYVKTKTDNHQLVLQKFINDNNMVGNNYIYNIMEYSGDYLVANITPEKYSYLFSIKEVNPDTIYINDPLEIQKISGIISTQQYVYLELFHNLSTLEVTQDVQPAHVKLLSDVMCFNGSYQTLTRINYKKQLYKDPVGLSLFEQCDMFIVNALLNPKTYFCNNFLSSALFGSLANYGSNVSRINLKMK